MNLKSILSRRQIIQLLVLAMALSAASLAQRFLVDGGLLNPFVTLNLLHLAINIILATSLNLINGFTGQFSIGHAGFMAIGAYVSAIFTVNLQPSLIALLGLQVLPVPLAEQLVFLMGLVAGAVAAGAVGFLIGLPTLRLRGDYLAIATLGFGEIIRIIIINIDYVGGPRGLMGIPQATNLIWATALAVVTILALSNFTQSSQGLACVSIREDEVAAEAMGVNTTRYKVLAFTMGSFFAGLGGGLFSHLVNIASPASFTFMRSVDILVMVVLGGMGSLTGSVVAAVLVTGFSAIMADYPSARMIIYSVLLVALMLFRPQGLMGNPQTVRLLWSRLGLGGRHGAA